MHRLAWPFILIVALAVIGCGSRSTTPAAKSVTTVSSFADATRRLELRGYSYVEESKVMGMRIVTYTKNAPDAAYSVEIVRWWGDPRLNMLIFYCGTNEAAFNSEESRRKLWHSIDADVSAMINDRQDFLRACADMKHVDGSGLSRFEGRATTADGWRIDAIEYVQSYKIEAGEKENKIGMATIHLTNLETEEAPASAELEYQREMKERRLSRESRP